MTYYQARKQEILGDRQRRMKTGAKVTLELHATISRRRQVQEAAESAARRLERVWR
jgi:hypothetical protein